MARPRDNSVAKQADQKEVPISILVWLGMMSNYPLESIPVNALSYILNWDYVSQNELVTRKGTSEFQDDTVTGALNSIVGATEFHKRGDPASLIYEITNNGKLYSLNSSIGGTPTLVGDLTTTETLQRVRTAAFKNKLYIADGVKGWVYDPSGPTLSQVTFPAEYSTAKFKDVKVFYNKLWWITDQDDVISSVPNDPTDYSSAGTWIATINEDDGLSLESMFRWGRTLIFTKYNDVTGSHSMYKLSGFDVDTFRIDDITSDDQNPVGFFGDSAVILGTEVIGLTRSGFALISAIDNFNEVSLNPLSIDIDDYVRRINWDAAHKITAIYDTDTKQYMCAAPIDASSVNNIVFIYDPAGKRWGLYDNWPVRTFFKVKNRVFYGSEYGTIIKTREGENDLGFGFNKTVEGPAWHFDSPETRKLFRSLDLEVAVDGDYNITLTPVINGVDTKAEEITIPVNATNRWDEFIWDKDRWDSPQNDFFRVWILARGRNLRFRLHNSNADEPIALKTMTIRSYITGDGDERP